MRRIFKNRFVNVNPYLVFPRRKDPSSPESHICMYACIYIYICKPARKIIYVSLGKSKPSSSVFSPVISRAVVVDDASAIRLTHTHTRSREHPRNVSLCCCHKFFASLVKHRRILRARATTNWRRLFRNSRESGEFYRGDKQLLIIPGLIYNDCACKCQKGATYAKLKRGRRWRRWRKK